MLAPKVLVDLLGRLRRDRDGTVAVTAALTMTALVGFSALGTETALWYVSKRTMQGAADSAALSAAVAAQNGANATGDTAWAKGIAAQYGFVDGSNSVTVAVNNPPASGPNTTNNSAFEVLISKPQAAILSALYLPNGITVTARAVALEGVNGNSCVLALDHANIADVTDVGNSTLNLNGCSLYIDSPNSSALTLNGSASITAQAAYIVGNVNDPSKITTTNGLHTGVSPIGDPYSNVTMPSAGACDYTNYTAPNGTVHITNPGGGTVTFCNGITINSQTSITFDPGTYVINGGTFKVNGGATVCAPTCSSTAPTSGDTFVLTGSGSNYANVDIEGGANVTVYAPPTGPTAGLAFFQDRNAPVIGAQNTNKFAGGSTQMITGAIYFPEQNVTYTGNSGATQAVCTQIVALTLNFNGTSDFNNNCTGTGTKTIGSINSSLVE